MKRFHIHVGVKNIEDPRLNFAISTRTNEEGVDHLGIQTENSEELAEMTGCLKRAGLEIYDEGETICCYARSDKAWVKDPSGVAWETYQNMADAEVFAAKLEAGADTKCC
jgi:hypothetical protein